MRPLAVSIALAALVGVAAPARADGRVSLSGEFAPVGDPAFIVHTAEVRGHHTLRAGLLVDYAFEPLVLTTPRQQRDPIVLEQAWAHAQASFTLSHRWLLALDVPVSAFASGDPEPDLGSSVARPRDSVAFGDVALTGRVKVLGPAGDGTKMALTATAWAPTGSRPAYTSDGSLRARAAAAVTGRWDRFVWSAEGGVLVRPSNELPAIVPMRTGPALTVGWAASYLVDAKRTLQVGPEVAANSGFSHGARLLDARSTAVQLLVGARLRPGAGSWVVGAAGGPGIGQAVGTPDFRVVVMAAWSPEKEPPPPDRDEDTVPDATDTCPELPGVPSSDPVMNGCPELPKDADGDAIPDGFDACPHEPGEPTGDRRTHGCPKSADSDGDTIPDRIDACPAQAGEPSPDPKKHGCPRDSDGDTIPDRLDACPTQAGEPSSDPKKHGCPPARAELVAEKITISEQVQFETGTAVLRESSQAVLSEVARILGAHPEIVRLEVQGHTDDTGSTEYNRDLSRQRAESVARWLAEHGVAAGRLEPRGFGRDHPIADNTTEEGRAKNRRVEFVILKRSDAPPAKGAKP